VCDEDDISTVLLVSLETEISILGVLLTTDLVTVLRGDLLFECFLGEESLGDLVVLIETGRGDLALRVVLLMVLVGSET